MNEIEAAKVLREAKMETQADLELLATAVAVTREDLVADNKDGKWAVRYPNGRRVASEADVVFESKARLIVNNLLKRAAKAVHELEEVKKVAEADKKAALEENDKLRQQVREVGARADELAVKVTSMESKLESVKAAAV